LHVNPVGTDTVRIFDSDGLGGNTNLSIALEGINLIENYTDISTLGINQATLFQDLIDDDHLNLTSSSR
jgi:hypothetical protein